MSVLALSLSALPVSPDGARPTVRPGRDLGRDLRERRAGALEAVYGEFAPTVFGHLLATLRDRATAEDVQQEVFAEIWRRSAEFDPKRGSLGAWIMTIARSRAIDSLRRRVPEPRDPETTRDLIDHTAEPAGDEAVDRWLMGHVLARLPEQERALLHMRFYSGMSQSEIAAATGIALGTVKMRMAAAMRRLRDLLEERGA